MTKIMFDDTKGRNQFLIGGNFMGILRKKLDALKKDEESLRNRHVDIDIAHDDDCSIFKMQPCDCAPEVTITVSRRN